MITDPLVRAAQSRDPQFAKRCRGKIQHATRELAEAALHNMRQGGKKLKGHVLQAYRCPYGDHWHVGNNSTKKMRRRRKQIQP